MAELVCIRDCHSCTLQEGNENKMMCATLLLPSMIKELQKEVQALKKGNEIKEVKLKKNSKNENLIEDENS